MFSLRDGGSGARTIGSPGGAPRRRLRRQLRPPGGNGDPLHTLDQDEAAIYALVHRTPLGTRFDALVRAGLLVPADATPAPVLDQAVGCRRMPSLARWWGGAPRPVAVCGARGTSC
jgi:hypothetical protein